MSKIGPKTLTVNECAKKYFARALKAGKTEITGVELKDHVCKETGSSREAASGTLSTSGKDSLGESPWFYDNWHCAKFPSGRVVYRRNQGGEASGIERMWNYDFPEKREACRRIMAYLPCFGTPNLVTLASCHGNCIQAARKQNPNVLSYNVERDQRVLDVWQGFKGLHGFQSIDSKRAFEDFVFDPIFTSRQFEIVNADVMGYAGAKMKRYLTQINRLCNTRIVALTTQHLTWFRNTNKSAERRRLVAKYTRPDGTRVPDAHRKAIAAYLSNYRLVERWTYRQDAQHDTMEVFIFGRKD